MHNFAPAKRGATPGLPPGGICLPDPRLIVVRMVRLSFAAALLAVVALVMAATLPALWGRHSVLIQGGSMGDALPVGSVAVMETIDANAIQVGDIIAVGGEEGLPYVHRVVGIEDIDGQRVATLKGDANGAADPRTIVLAGQGDRLDYYVPWVAYLLVYVRTPLGLTGLAVLAVTLLAWPPKAQRHRQPLAASAAVTGELATLPTDLMRPMQSGKALRRASARPPAGISLRRLRPNRSSTGTAPAESGERLIA